MSSGEGDLERADRQLLDGIATWSALARDYPDAFDIHQWIAEANFRRAQILVQSGRIDEAKACHQDAVLRMERLVSEHPEIDLFEQWLQNFQSDTTLSGILNRPAEDAPR